VIWEHPDAKVGMNSFPARNKSHFHIANSKAALRKRIPSRVNKVYSPDEEFSGLLGHNAQKSRRNTLCPSSMLGAQRLKQSHQLKTEFN